ncbi:MAG: DinB family protein [Streptosporangiales bacterium]|nr:DinB family protein [Streptosporangiales bacterium]
MTRTPPPTIADERSALSARLDFLRATMVMKLDGLDDGPLRRPMTPTGLSLLGLVKHLTQVEHSWFVRRVGGKGGPKRFDPDAEFRVLPDETTRSVVDGYLRACEDSRTVVAEHSLDDTFEHPRHGTTDLRWVLVHMVEETARHAGHADIIREQLDGATGV